jgi:hypothetical protein
MATDHAVEPALTHAGQLVETSKRFTRRLLNLGLLLLGGGLTPALWLVGAPLFPPLEKGEANPAPESAGHGHPSPVTIGLHDIRYFDGSVRLRNESVARVNTLVFRRKSGPSKMDITVASVKRKDAGDNFLQNLLGGLKGTTVSLFMPPITVERASSDAMLNFGLALALEAPAFTFPRAKNLRAGG